MWVLFENFTGHGGDYVRWTLSDDLSNPDCPTWNVTPPCGKCVFEYTRVNNFDEFRNRFGQGCCRGDTEIAAVPESGSPGEFIKQVDNEVLVCDRVDLFSEPV